MKKLIIVLFFLVALSPLSASAQTVSNEQLLSIIQSLMQQVLILMDKLKTMESQQQIDSQKLGSIQSTVTVLNSKPVYTQPSTAISVSLGTPYCNVNSGSEKTAFIPVIISGNGWAYAKTSPVGQASGWTTYKVSGGKLEAQVRTNTEVTLVTTVSSTEPVPRNNYQEDIIYTSTDNITVGDLCK